MPSQLGRRAPVALVLVSLLLGVVGCGSATMPSASAAPATATGDAVTTSSLQAFLGNGLTFVDHGSFGLDKGRLVTEAGAPGGRLLRVSYPEGSASRAAGGPDGGLQAYLHTPGGPVDAMELQYSVRFPAGFEFVKGGKLPGLYGGTVTGGRVIPDGTDGLSTRYMWRAKGAGEVYAYLPTSQEHGTSLGRGCWSFTPGTWSTMRQRVVLNSAGHSDGRVTVWQDGRQVLDQAGLQFRTADTLQIDGLFFSTFFGGSDTSWASPADQYADFAGFTVTVGAGSPSPPPATGGAASPCDTASAP